MPHSMGGLGGLGLCWYCVGRGFKLDNTTQGVGFGVRCRDSQEVEDEMGSSKTFG